MKYSKANPPLVCMMTQSTCYKGTRTMEVKGVLWHSTGANNPTLKRYVQPDDNASDKAKMLELIGINTNHNDWNHIDRQAGLNCWIGKLADGTVTTIQTMPWNYRPWGCGSGNNGSCNNGWIQFEICEDDLANKTYFNQVYKEACEITAYLCQLYNINPKGTIGCGCVYNCPTILCHIDSYNLGLGSGHSDVLHWFSKYGKTMEDVRNDVYKLMQESVKTNQQTTNKPVSNVSTNSPKTQQTISTNNANVYKVCCGTYFTRLGAELQKLKLKRAGFDSIIVKNGSTYTIQVGVYKDKNNATAQVEKLKKAKFSATIKQQ